MRSGRAQIGVLQKMRNKILRGVSEVRFKKNSTPSPWKRRKTSSAIFCATGALGLNDRFHGYADPWYNFRVAKSKYNFCPESTVSGVSNAFDVCRQQFFRL